MQMSVTKSFNKSINSNTNHQSQQFPYEIISNSDNFNSNHENLKFPYEIISKSIDFNPNHQNHSNSFKIIQKMHLRDELYKMQVYCKNCPAQITENPSGQFLHNEKKKNYFKKKQ